jgi:hypothetical protein
MCLLRNVFRLRFSIVYLISLLTAATALIQSSPVQAGIFAMTCTGTSSTTYNPGITNTSQSVTFNSNQTYSCVPIGGNPQLTGGQTSASGTYAVSCMDLLQSGFPPSTTTYPWNDGTQSVVQYTSSTVSYDPLGNLVIAQTGNVQSGTGQGDTVLETITLVTTTALQTSCQSPQGVQSLTGPVTLAFLPL